MLTWQLILKRLWATKFTTFWENVGVILLQELFFILYSRLGRDVVNTSPANRQVSNHTFQRREIPHFRRPFSNMANFRACGKVWLISFRWPLGFRWKGKEQAEYNSHQCIIIDGFDLHWSIAHSPLDFFQLCIVLPLAYHKLVVYISFFLSRFSKANSAFHHPGTVNEYQLWLKRQSSHGSGCTWGVQVKLWDPLRTRAIPERLGGVITTKRYTNPRLPLPLSSSVAKFLCILSIYTVVLDIAITFQWFAVKKNNYEFHSFLCAWPVNFHAQFYCWR